MHRAYKGHEMSLFRLNIFEVYGYTSKDFDIEKYKTLRKVF